MKSREPPVLIPIAAIVGYLIGWAISRSRPGAVRDSGAQDGKAVTGAASATDSDGSDDFKGGYQFQIAEYSLLQLRGVCLSGEYRSSNSAHLQLAGRCSWAHCSVAGYWVSGTGVLAGRVVSASSSGRDAPVEMAAREGRCPARCCDAHSP
jgi:hypothetical protein